MKILYISVHSVLEFDEVSLFTECGHDVFSLGAYHNLGHPDLPRPSIPNLQFHEDLNNIYVSNPNRNELHPTLIEWADVIMIMHSPEVLSNNWERIKHKRVVLRTIGQNTPSIERMIGELKKQGLKVVRYSPRERHLPHYAGEDALIRFYKDPNDLTAWNGNDKKAINITQSLKGRRHHCHYDHIIELMAGFTSKVFGTGNEDLGVLNGGELPYDLLKGQLRDSRVFVYGGTWPASYTLSFIDAWMTGIPIVSIGHKLAQAVPGVEPLDFFEIPDLIQNGENGFWGDDINELRSYIGQLISNDSLANLISKNSRERAIHLFGKDNIKQEWLGFLGTL